MSLNLTLQSTFCPWLQSSVLIQNWLGLMARLSDSLAVIKFTVWWLLGRQAPAERFRILFMPPIHQEKRAIQNWISFSVKCCNVKFILSGWNLVGLVGMVAPEEDEQAQGTVPLLVRLVACHSGLVRASQRCWSELLMDRWRVSGKRPLLQGNGRSWKRGSEV